MRAAFARLLFWVPRVLGILFALFLVVFALDVFEPGVPGRVVAVRFALHLVPTLLLLAVLAVSWRYGLVGAVVFAGLGLLYIVGLWGRFPVLTYATIAGPLLLIAGLFLADWLVRRHASPGRPATPTH